MCARCVTREFFYNYWQSFLQAHSNRRQTQHTVSQQHCARTATSRGASPATRARPSHTITMRTQQQRPATSLVVFFSITTAVHIAVALALAGWPLRGWLAGGSTLGQLLQLYRPTESNIDVALLAVLQSITFIILVACTTPTPRGIAYDGVRRPFSKVRLCAHMPAHPATLSCAPASSSHCASRSSCCLQRPSPSPSGRTTHCGQTPSRTPASAVSCCFWPPPVLLPCSWWHSLHWQLPSLRGTTNTCVVWCSVFVCWFCVGAAGCLTYTRREATQDAMDGLKEPLLGDAKAASKVRYAVLLPRSCACRHVGCKAL